MINSRITNVVPTTKIKGVLNKIGATLAYGGQPIGLLLVLTYSNLITQTSYADLHVKIGSINPSSRIK